MEEERTALADVVKMGKFHKVDSTFLGMMGKNPADFWAVAGYADRMFQEAQYGLAFHLYRYCLDQWKDIDPSWRVIMWANLGHCLKHNGFDAEAEMAFGKALSFSTDKKQISAVWLTRGIFYVGKGQPEKVIEYCDKALEADPESEVPMFDRGLAYLEMGRWKEGWEGYCKGERGRNPRCYHSDKPTQPWDGKRKRNVVVWGEQGVGDEIMFGSCLPDMIGSVDRVILDCHPRLEKTWKRSFPGLTVYPTRKSVDYTWWQTEKIDKQVSIADLPRHFRNRDGDFPGVPFLKADPERVKHYRAKLQALGPAPYVAIAWFGGENKTRWDYRSIPLNLWHPLRAKGGTFVSVQYNKWGHQAEAEKNGIQSWDGYYDQDGPIEDLDEMFALIEACDLVISVCQTAIHMAGALGKECWCLTPNKPAWRYLITGDRMPWYNSVRLIRQGKDEEWKSVIERTAGQYQAWKANRSGLHQDVQDQRSAGVAGMAGSVGAAPQGVVSARGGG